MERRKFGSEIESNRIDRVSWNFDTYVPKLKIVSTIWEMSVRNGINVD